MLSRATCVTPSRPCLLPGPRCCHPLTLRTRCSSSWSGPCAARRHKAGKRTSDVRPREEQRCGGRDAGPRARHERRQDRGTNGDGFCRRRGGRPHPRGARPPGPPAPPRPAAAPAVRRRQSFCRRPGFPGGTTHLVAPPCTGGQGWAQRGCAFRRGRGSAASSAGRTSGEQGEGAGVVGRGGAPELPSSSLPPGRDRARGAALGRGQRFFVSPAPSAPHRGSGPHPGSFLRDINFSDYARVRKRLHQL